MNGGLELSGSEKLTELSLRKRAIGQEAQAERIDLVAQGDLAGKGILCAVDLLGEYNVGRLIPREIAGIYSEWTLSRGRVGVVQPEVAGDEVGATILVEIARRETVPPAVHRRQSGCSRNVSQTFAVVSIKPNGHPFAGGDEVEPAVPIEIDPDRVSDHPAGTCELGRDLFSHIGEAAAIVSQQVAARAKWIFSR